MKLTDHFTFEELTDSKKFPDLVPQNRIDAEKYLKRLKYLAGTWEEIRAILGVKIIITSGYRNEALNTAVGGSKTSKHREGLCGDGVPVGMSVNEAFDLIMANRDKCPSLRKCIIEGVKGKTWLHIQTKLEASEPTDFYTTNNGVDFTKVG